MWDAALASHWSGPPVWVHGDVAVGNLLVANGRLSAVIDFGTCGIGDPACDFVIAWLLFDEASQAVFRKASGVDGACWVRARGWGIWKALLLASRDERTHPAEREPLAVIATIVAEHRAGF